MGMNELANQVVQIETDDTELDDLTQINSSRTCIRRNKPGCSAQKWSDWPEEDLDDMESTLAVQQVNFLLYFLFKINLFIKLTFKFIQQLIKKNPNDVDTILKAPEQQDEGVWKYEHLRQFCMDLNIITVRLQQECSPSTCSQMTATEQWIFLCAAHKNPKEVIIQKS
jgi:hypothetical protein